MQVSTVFLSANYLLTTYRIRWGIDKDKIPREAGNFFYGKTTSNSNLRNHLLKKHPKEYDKAVSDYKWKYRLSTQSPSNDPSTHNIRNLIRQGLPPFSRAAFLEHLVRFIVTDDQVRLISLHFILTLTSCQSIRVVECPEFRQLCMLLRESLDDADIPHRDKMKEVILSHWRTSFEDLKADLSVSSISMSLLHQPTDIDQ